MQREGQDPQNLPLDIPLHPNLMCSILIVNIYSPWDPSQCLSYSVSYISSHFQAGSPQPHPGPTAPAPSPGHSAPSCPSCHPAGAEVGGQDMQAAGYPFIALAAQWRRGGGAPQIHLRLSPGSRQGRGTGKPPSPLHVTGECAMIAPIYSRVN